MENYNILGHNLKRGIINFCNKASKGLGRPSQKFVADMVYGIIASKSCFLSEIARKLNEKIKLDKTVDRLSRNLMDLENTEGLRANYFKAVKKCFDENTVLIIDDSDIAKPCSTKLEGLCKVHDVKHGRDSRQLLVCGRQRAYIMPKAAYSCLRPCLLDKRGRLCQQQRGNNKVARILVRQFTCGQHPCV